MVFVRWFLILVLAGILGVGAFVGWCWKELHDPITHTKQFEPIEIGRGARLEQILGQLQENGIISHSLPLRLYMKWKHKEPIVQAGAYYFNSPITPLAVLDKLGQGARFDRVTVIEGWNRWDIADAIAHLPALKLQNRDQVLPLLNDARSIQDLDPQATSLEGFLFPDTYFIVANSSPTELVLDMVERFRAVWEKQLAAEAAAQGISPHDAVTMASIIETEAKLKSERPIIASVIKNRLKRNMPLSMDSTLVYASKMVGAWRNDGKVYQSDIDRPSPYNTRKNVGLPPGPVGSPGLSSLEAAIKPASTDYLYYVRNPDRNDGAHNFYADEKSFQAGVQALRNWEKKQPSGPR